MAITPHGNQVIIASGEPYYHQAWRTSDLVEVRQYPTDAYPNSVVVNDDGRVIARYQRSL